ncbi:MAG: RluA family pseudouridine synthase [Deltaproteobacteria bacterium]|nr:RluA family pseudouridine synthase [Deltaproteobacteria bacterium]
MNCFKVGRREEGSRLDRFLQEKTSLSRKKVKGLLDQGQIYLNNRKVVIASWQVKQGALIEIRKETGLRHPTADKYFLKVVYEDSDLLVVEKDAGVPCEESPQATEPTILEIINAYLKRKYPHLKRHYVGPVHRLDRDTSGLMVFTKKREANKLTDQFKRHVIKRRYLAIVEGAVEGERGKIEGFLQKNQILPGGRKVKPSTIASGKRAVTYWRLKERYAAASLLEITLNTGRTHQIRVHMASIGHPVMGDKIYGHGGGLQRQALHASFLGFWHPLTGQEMEFESDLPRDMRRLVDRLRFKS